MRFAIDWSKLYQARNVIKKEFPSIWGISLIKKETALLVKHLHSHIDVLEVGAGDRRLSKFILNKYPTINYKSFDIDKSTEHDFYALEEICGKFDLIYGFELIEHLTVEDGVEMLRKLKSHLKANGVLILGTPNLYHPHRYFGDLTHVTPYKYEELGALLKISGFSVECFYRKYNAPFFMRIFRIYFFSVIHKLLDIDFANTIFVTAKIGSQD